MDAIAWAAGFYEGEGSCGCYNVKGYESLRLVISQAEPEPLIRFKDALGFGKIYGPYPYRNRPTRKPIWHYKLARAGEIMTVISALWPWLSRRRKDQFAAAMKKWRGY